MEQSSTSSVAPLLSHVGADRKFTGQLLRQRAPHDATMEDAMARYTVEEEPERDTTHDVCDRFESLNFDKIMSNLWVIKWAKGMHTKAETDEEKDEDKSIVPHEAARQTNRVIVTALIGITIGLIATFISKGVGWLTDQRYDAIHAVYKTNPYAAIALFFLWNLTLAVLSSVTVVYLAPGAKGSGIPEVKAYLNGVNIPQFMRLSTFAVMVQSTITGVASGLAIGPEGPLVHIGATLGSAFTYGRKKLQMCPGLSLDLHFGFLKEFNSDISRRDFITIGASAGFSSAFGAPIGGVMFGMEECATHFPHKMLWRTLMATAIACFTVFFMSEAIGEDADISSYGVLSFGKFVNPELYPWELPLFLLLGAFMGLLGALFNHMAHIFFHFRKHTIKQKHHHVAEIALISLVTSLITILLVQYTSTCMPMHRPGEPIPGTNRTSPPIRRTWAVDKSLSDTNCEDGYFSDMAFLWLANREDALKAVIMDPTAFSWQEPSFPLFGISCLLMFVAFGMCTSWTFGTSITSGIFMPIIMIGACLGACAGRLVQNYAPESWCPDGPIGVGPWALIGAAGLLGGVQRTAISLCVIILEGTGQIRFLLPTILAVGMATYVGDLINHGVYHVVLHCKATPCGDRCMCAVDRISDCLPTCYLQEIPFLEPFVKGHHGVYARDVMTAPVKTMGHMVQVREALDLLQTTTHHGFPITRPTEDGQGHQFEGILLRSQLEGLLVKRAYQGEQCLRKRRGSVDEVILTTRPGEGISVKGEMYSSDEQRKWISCEDVLNRQPYTVQEDCPFQRLYHLFVNCGLRHLVVLSKTGEVVGIITRSNIYRATEQHSNLEQHAALRDELPELYQQLLIDGALSDGVITRDEWEESLARVRAKGHVPEGPGLARLMSPGMMEPGNDDGDDDEADALDANLPKSMTLQSPRGVRSSEID